MLYLAPSSGRPALMAARITRTLCCFKGLQMTETNEFDGTYSFDEFCEHFTDIAERRRPVADSDEIPSFEETAVNLFQYMDQRITDPDERRYKSERFMVMANYISSNINEFDTADFAVHGSDVVGALIGEHLLHAVHELFTSPDGSRLGYNPDPMDVMSLAESYRESKNAT